MSLKTCHECGHKVSSEAAACPGCGAQVRSLKNSGKKFLRLVWYSMFAFIAAVIFYSVFTTTTLMQQAR
jgi:uncharacterized membrane protein YvbJ